MLATGASINLLLDFFAGVFLANGIPHFVNGISGKSFFSPSLHRLVPNVPAPVFNVIWGLLNFGLALVLLSLAPKLDASLNGETIATAGGFVFASIGLAVYFPRRELCESQDPRTKRH